jgi:hypothetical protein
MTRAARNRIVVGALLALLPGCTTLGGPPAAAERPSAIPGGGRAVRLFNVDIHDGLIGSLAGHGATLYFARIHDGADPDELWAIPKMGGQAVQLLAREKIETAPVFDDAFAYFVGTGGQVMRARLPDGAAEVLVTAGAIDAAVAPGAARDRSRRPRYALGNRSALLPSAMAVDSGFIYWLDHATNAAMKASKTGGQPIALAAGLEDLSGRVVLDGPDVYMRSGGRLLRLKRAAPGPAEVLAPHPAGPRSFAVMGGRVLWEETHRLFRLSATGDPTPLELPDLPPHVTELEVAGDTLLYAVRGSAEAEGPAGYVITESLQTGAMHKVSNGHIAPAALVVDGNAVFFVEIGFEERLKGEEMREECCSIWQAAR